MPVKAMTMPRRLHSSITASSRMEPPGSAMYFTPDFAARLMLSENGKNASEPSATFFCAARKASFSPAVSGAGCSVK